MNRMAVLLVLLFACNANAQNIADKLGPVTPGPVDDKRPIQVPYFTWGGDVAAFMANGNSLRTKPDSIYGMLGLDLKFVAGDNVLEQTRRYLSGESPYWRGTLYTANQLLEIMSASEDTTPVCIMCLGWSLGDYVVATEDIKTMSDLKGATVIYHSGRHIGLLSNVLKNANLDWSDIELIEVDDLTGENGVAETFRKAVAEGKKTAACVITPDMIGITSGINEKGSGAEGTVRGAHVLDAARSDANVWLVRSDYLRDHRNNVEKLVAGCLQTVETLQKIRNNYEEGDNSGTFKGLGEKYRNVLRHAQVVFGKNTLPTLEVDAHALMLDTEFVGIYGQAGFFENYVDEITNPQWDYRRIAKIADIPYDVETNVDSESIYSFTVKFEPNDTKFNENQYALNFKRAFQASSGDTTILVEGHSDTLLVLTEIIKLGMKNRMLTKDSEEETYRLRGLVITKELLDEAIKFGKFDGDEEYNPRRRMQDAVILSQSRAEAVAKAITNYASSRNVDFDESKLKVIGVGVSRPLIARPINAAESRKNMRVEVKVIRVKK